MPICIPYFADRFNVLPSSPAGTNWSLRLKSALNSLKVRITLVSVAALATGIVATTGLLIHRAEQDTLIAQQVRELRATARAANTLSRRMANVQAALAVTGARLDASTLGDKTRLLEFIRNQPVLMRLFTNVYVAAPDGQLLAMGDARGVRRPEWNVSDQGYFRRTIDDQQPVVSEPLPHPVTGQPSIILTYPLKNAGGLYGVLHGVLGLSDGELIGDLIDPPGTNSQMLLAVTDAKGRIVAHSNQLSLLAQVSADPRLGEAYRQWADAGSRLDPNGFRVEHSTEMVSAATVRATGWMMWRATPRAKLLVPLREARERALWWASGMTLSMSLLMLALLWWLLRPLSQLEHRAQHLFDGQDDSQVPWPQVGGEIGRLAGVLRRVGIERARLESDNAAVLAKLSSVMAAAPIGIAFARSERFELLSAQFNRLFGRTEQDMLGRPTQMIFASNADYQRFIPQVRKAFRQGESYVGEWQMLRANGSLFWAELRGRPINPRDAAAGTIWTLNNIDEQITARAQLEWSASHDVLTGLANRTAFEERAHRLFAASPRALPAAIVVIDLDHFKPVNDSCGHAAGDAMLRAVAAAITSRIRASDLAVRLGGDEFALLLEGCTHEVAMRIAENVRAAISAIQLNWERRTLGVGASIGVASLSAATPSTAVWLAEADAACYKAKDEGRGTVRSAALKVVGSRGDGGE